MSTATRSTRRARFSRRAAIAAVATAGLGAGIAAAPAAFAADGPGSVLNGTVVVGSTLTIHPSVQSFSITAVPGVPVSSPYTVVIHSTDSAGYDLSQALTTQFGGIGNQYWTAGQEAYDGHQDPWTINPVNYNAAGDAITLYGSSSLSGSNPYLGGGGTVQSDSVAGTDTITTQVGLTLPPQFPGSPQGGYQGAFTMALVGR